MARRPDIALRVHGGLAPAACVAQATVADRGGFSTLWFAENPFTRGVWPAMAACALATRRLRIGAGVFNPYARHPTLMAMEMGAVDELSAGRAVLGIGAGIAGKIGRLKVASDRPILTAAMGDQALRLCGEIADGLMISNMCPLAYTRRAVALVREAAMHAGRTMPREVVQYVPCAIGDDGVAARATAKVAVAGMLTAYGRSASAATRTAMTASPRLDGRDWARMIERLERGEPPAHVIDDAVLAEYAVAGTLDDCLAQCARYGEAGVTELGVWFVGDHALEDIARLGEALARSGS